MRASTPHDPRLDLGGAIYGVELLRALKDLGQETHLVMSEAAVMTLGIETQYSLDEVRALASVVYPNKDIGAAVASCHKVGAKGRHSTAPTVQATQVIWPARSRPLIGFCSTTLTE